jgi:polygalacturonase
MRSVRDFGAQGDGVTLDTESIQDAIDDCSAGEGGAVHFPPGRFLTGSLFLRSCVRMHLEHGAVLLGSPNPDDYTGALIRGEGLDNVAIEGGGTINGQGQAFWTGERLAHNVRKPKPDRPHALIHLVKCTNVRLRDIRLEDSPCYTVWLLGCENGLIDGVTIDNPLDAPNTDGLDVDCCRDIRIANCSIRAGDDCIALKSDTARLGENMPCEDIVVSNCTLSSTACAVRVGYEGDGVIRNCSFSNLVIRDTDIGLDIVSILPGAPNPGLNITSGACIERISFANTVMDNVNRPFFIWMGNETERPFGGAIRDIVIDGLTATAKAAGYIGGTPEHCVEGVEIRGARIAIAGNAADGATNADQDVWGARTPPHAIICRNVRDLRLDGVRLDWTRASGTWKSEMEFVNVEGLILRDFRSDGFERVSCENREEAGQ